MKKGRFVVFEGIDGSGKSSCMEAAVTILGKERDVIGTAEPTDGDIKRILEEAKDITPEGEAMLFITDRMLHTREIMEWMKEGKVVLCDRYYASTIAYQSAELNGRRADAVWLEEMNDKIAIEPDMTLLFDIDPILGMERVESRGSKSRFERIGYLTEVRDNYLRIAKERGFVIIDASRPKDEVLEEVLRHISRIL